MPKALKRILIILLVLALLAGGTYGGLTVYRNMNKKPVNVYQVANFAQTNMWMDQSESSGSVRMDNMQKIYLSDTQTVTEVFVHEGQQVKKGDPLIAFDTTLSKLDVEKAEIALEKQKMELDNQQKVLEKLQHALITEELEWWINSLQAQLQAAYDSMPEPEYPELPMGKWTADEPRYIENPGVIDPEALLSESGKDDIYVVFVDAADGQYFGYYGLQISKGEPEVIPADPEEPGEGGEEDPEVTESASETAAYSAEAGEDQGASEDPENPEEPETPAERPLRLAVFSPSPIEPEYPEEPPVIASLQAQIDYAYTLYDNAYSRSELAELKASTGKAISDLELEIRIAEVNLEKAKAEVNDGTVRANIDGEITSVLPLEEMGTAYDAVLVLSGGGGYYITGSIGEFDREKLEIGQAVTVNSYMNGMMYEGTVTEIGDRPAEQNGWSGGNNNVSWYPFTVFVDASAELQEGDWVGLTYNPQAQAVDNAWYLQKFLIREENGRPYVYKRGEDGLLVKQYITTGKILWNELYEVRSGLTMEDYVAFPYGRDVVNGADTVEASPDQLYEGMN